MGTKQPSLNTRDFRLAKSLYIACLTMIGIFVGLFGPWTARAVSARNSVGMSASDVNTTIMFFVAISVLSIVAGYFLSRFAMKSSLERKWLLVSLYRIGSFMPLTAGGIVLGFLGARLLIVMLFFLSSAASLLVTFPTKNSWKKTP